jgi:hypothetical protein
MHEVNHKLRSRRFQVAKATVLVDLIQSGQLTKV